MAEVGTDLSRFPDAEHLSSWAGVCPGHKESAGKRLSGRAKQGKRYVRATLVQAAHGVRRTKTYLGDATDGWKNGGAVNEQHWRLVTVFW